MIRFKYLGKFHARRAPAQAYHVPTFGYMSLAGVQAAVLKAVNHDRQLRGWRPVTEKDIPLRTIGLHISRHDWSVFCVDYMLCFTLEAP